MSERSDHKILPESLLFVCSMNAVRSPMAEAITKSLYGTKIFIDSVGIRDDLDDVNPFAVSVLEEIGVDLSNHIPKNFEALTDTSFDLVITLSPEAHHRALDLTRFFSTDVEYWPTMDPTATTGNRENIMSSFREVRDYLTGKIKKRLGE